MVGKPPHEPPATGPVPAVVKPGVAGAGGPAAREGRDPVAHLEVALPPEEGGGRGRGR